MSRIEKDGVYLLYLRKSRADNPNESVEEVLAKHEKLLQDYFERELGHRITEDCIYREVVSGGESLAERVEISRVLSRIEDKEVLGVAVADPQRLSRGSLTDCDILIDRFRFTNTLVITPMMVYNLENKMERRFFQDELMRGRDYLEYVKEALWRGRVQSALSGKYSSSTPPYGYDRIKVGKDWTLTPNDNAEVVQMIFDLYVNDDLTPSAIADKLNEMGIKSARGKNWARETIIDIVRNKHYDGKIVFCRRRQTVVYEGGEKRVSVLVQKPEDTIIVDGRHQAIIDRQLFELAQAKANRREEQYAPKVKRGKHLSNVLAGVLHCKNCGRPMRQLVQVGLDYYTCPTKGCCKRTNVDTLLKTLTTALVNEELPNLEAKAKSGIGKPLEMQKTIINRLEKQMAEYRSQEDTQYELLETRQYTAEVFNKRHTALRSKMNECQAQLDEAKKNLPDAINYEEKVTSLKNAIKSLNDSSISTRARNRLVKSVIQRIDYSSTPHQPRGVNDFSIEITLNV